MLTVNDERDVKLYNSMLYPIIEGVAVSSLCAVIGAKTLMATDHEGYNLEGAALAGVAGGALAGGVFSLANGLTLFAQRQGCAAPCYSWADQFLTSMGTVKRIGWALAKGAVYASVAGLGSLMLSTSIAPTETVAAAATGLGVINGVGVVLASAAVACGGLGEHGHALSSTEDSGAYKSMRSKQAPLVIPPHSVASSSSSSSRV